MTWPQARYIWSAAAESGDRLIPIWGLLWYSQAGAAWRSPAPLNHAYRYALHRRHAHR
ncbi:MAG: hypothetical protein HC910_16190 [Spirulinaceae cyanobacterium SM2_1_0]|nr:hypothetical protein [Spirulinaceae cyanobacterium SM2_1_0]